MTIERLGPGRAARARELFALLARVFDERQEALDQAYLEGLLDDQRFWALAAVEDEGIIGGLTAWELPLTARQSHELMIYDLAVDPAHWRQGVGGRLVGALREQAREQAIRVAWVPVDNEDTHALDFYRAIGGTAEPVTIVTFGEPS
ncbi:GNAT family N-acetyltransferase [Pseudohaliea sp.]|uniref:GNAT family N-acetyltransferase n=1 Tax=Pseudohaliea sp. TaxID=2740289 RepID=UPI0032EB76F9